MTTVFFGYGSMITSVQLDSHKYSTLKLIKKKVEEYLPLNINFSLYYNGRKLMKAQSIYALSTTEENPIHIIEDQPSIDLTKSVSYAHKIKQEKAKAKPECKGSECAHKVKEISKKPVNQPSQPNIIPTTDNTRIYSVTPQTITNKQLISPPIPPPLPNANQPIKPIFIQPYKIHEMPSGPKQKSSQVTIQSSESSSQLDLMKTLRVSTKQSALNHPKSRVAKSTARKAPLSKKSLTKSQTMILPAISKWLTNKRQKQIFQKDKKNQSMSEEEKLIMNQLFDDSLPDDAKYALYLGCGRDLDLFHFLTTF